MDTSKGIENVSRCSRAACINKPSLKKFPSGQLYTLPLLIALCIYIISLFSQAPSESLLAVASHQLPLWDQVENTANLYQGQQSRLQQESC